LEVAQNVEVTTHRLQGIGGAIQAAIITAEGPKVADPQWYDNLKAGKFLKAARMIDYAFGTVGDHGKVIEKTFPE